MTWLDDFAAYGQQNLTETTRDALSARGVSDEQMAQYQIGYLGQGLPDLPYTEDFLGWSRAGARISDAFVLPLTTATGLIQGFQFRSVDRARKGYLNYMPYKEEALLFGLAQALPHVWKTGAVWLVEGAFDLFPIQRHFPGVIATLTAKVPDNLVALLRRLAQAVLVGYDADPAGQAATKQFDRAYKSAFNIHPVSYPPVVIQGTTRCIKDPGELWEAWGDDQVGRFVQTVLNSTVSLEIFSA